MDLRGYKQRIGASGIGVAENVGNNVLNNQAFDTMIATAKGAFDQAMGIDPESLAKIERQRNIENDLRLEKMSLDSVVSLQEEYELTKQALAEDGSIKDDFLPVLQDYWNKLPETQGLNSQEDIVAYKQKMLPLLSKMTQQVVADDTRIMAGRTVNHIDNISQNLIKSLDGSQQSVEDAQVRFESTLNHINHMPELQQRLRNDFNKSIDSKFRSDASTALYEAELSKDPREIANVLDQYGDQLTDKEVLKASNDIEKYTQEAITLKQTDRVAYDNKFKGITWQDSYLAQVQEDGIAPSRARVMSQNEAKNNAHTLQNIANTENMWGFLDAINAKYGMQKSNAIRDMRTMGGLPDIYSFMVGLEKGDVDDEEMMDLAHEVSKTPAKSFKDYASFLLRSKEGVITASSLNKAEQEIYGEIAGFLDVLRREGAEIQTMRDNATKIAVQKIVNMGGDIDGKDAGKWMSDFLTKQYNMVSFGNTTARIPKEFDPDEVEDGLKYLETEITPFISAYKDYTTEQLLDNSQWVMSPDATGMRLHRRGYGMDNYVIGEDGKPIFYSFKDILAAKDRIKKAEREAFEASLPKSYKEAAEMYGGK